jgi:succinate dehydrogenase / fumarate reductase cytochrome b subunit
MSRFSSTAFTSIGKKIFMAVSGLALSGFIIVHLTGNIALLYPDKDPFNKYANFLQGLGPLLYTAEIVLAAIFLIHFFYAVFITIGNWRARPGRYRVSCNAGHTSKKTIASTTMVYTGILIITFTVLHLLQFKYGAVIMYTTKDGIYIRDLYAVVHQFFGNIWNVVFYMIIMILLGFHLSHGFWSAFQSLGINGVWFTRFVYGFGYLFAVVMAAGFLLLPLYIFLNSGGIHL